MDITKQTKIDRFLKDEVMSQAVFDVVLKAFIKNKGSKAVRDVYVLASERLAIDLLFEAWQELSKYKSSENADKTALSQVGL